MIVYGTVRDVEILAICILVLLQGKAQAGEGDRDGNSEGATCNMCQIRDVRIPKVECDALSLRIALY